jgi:hypothetical protein
MKNSESASSSLFTYVFPDLPKELIYKVFYLCTGLTTVEPVKDLVGSLRIKLFWVSSGLNGLSLDSSVTAGFGMISFFLPFF